MAQNKIPEHYHVGWIDKDNHMFEVLVTTIKKKWGVVDEWGDVDKEGKILGKFNKSKDAIFYALDILSNKFNGGKPVYGAGAPSNKIIEEWSKKVAKKEKNDYDNCHCKVDREITSANVCKRCGGTVKNG